MDDRAKGGAQVVMRAVLEVHFVADIKTQPNGTEMSLKAAARIESSHHVVVTKTRNRARECSECGGRLIQAEIYNPAFNRHERLNGMSSQVDAWAKQAMNYAQIRTLESCAYATWRGSVREILGERPAEVVGHFAFEL